MVVIVMGVTGAGKTTVGKLLAAQQGWEFLDADSFHSPENVEKMRRGIALDDADRGPWLNAMRDAINRWIAEARNVVLACSALKRIYRLELAVSGDVKGRQSYLKVQSEWRDEGPLAATWRAILSR